MGHMRREAQARVIDQFTADAFRNANPNVAGGSGSAPTLNKGVGQDCRGSGASFSR